MKIVKVINDVLFSDAQCVCDVFPSQPQLDRLLEQGLLREVYSDIELVKDTTLQVFESDGVKYIRFENNESIALLDEGYIEYEIEEGNIEVISQDPQGLNFYYKQGEIIEFKNEDIIMPMAKEGRYLVKFPCSRCGGHKELTQFKHVDDGVCFKCMGSGTINREVKLYTKEDAIKHQKRYIAKQIKDQKIKEDKEYQEFLKRVEEFEALPTMLTIVVDKSIFEDSGKAYMASKGFRYDKNIKRYIGYGDIEGYDFIQVIKTRVYDLTNQDIKLNYEELREAIREQQNKGKLNEYFGEKGQKYIVPLKFVFAKDIDTSYGVSTLLMMEDEQGRKFKTFTTSSKLLNTIDIGTPTFYNVQFTVKDFQQYNGERSTLITRCSLKKSC